MITLDDLQASVMDKSAFNTLSDFYSLGLAFLEFLERTQPTHIVSPKDELYFFYQYDQAYRYKITRPLNSLLFFKSKSALQAACERFAAFLLDLKKHQEAISERRGTQEYLVSNEINRVVYTLQQSIGCISDSFENPNRSRKRVGQLFETLVKLIIQEVGLVCESRTLRIPIPGYEEEGYQMTYELDLVFSRDKVVITSETNLIHPSEVVGSVKTTSKDRLDKIFLDKFMLTQLLGREIPVIAIFLHDIQRARTHRGQSIFGVNSTFKSNHFLGYTVALTRLDGVYYVDRRPVMVKDPRLSREIQDFQRFLVKDLWSLSAR